MNIFATRGGTIASLVALTVTITGNTMHYLIESTKLFDVEMDHITGGFVHSGALVVWVQGRVCETDYYASTLC